MLKIDPHASQQIRPLLLSDEHIIWAAAPNPNIIFHSDDWTAIPFSIAWLGFAIFWEASVLGLSKPWSLGNSNWFMALWGIPFIAIGNYMLWGRFLWDAWLKRHTYYAITNRRVVFLQHGWKHESTSIFIREIPLIEREGMTTGTLWLGTKYPVIAGRGQKTRSISRFTFGNTPTLADIDEVESVQNLLLELCAKDPSSKMAGDPLSYSARP